MRKNTRKCSICKEDINLEDTEKYFVEKVSDNNRWTHCLCYVEKQTTKKIKPKSEEECWEHIKKCIEQWRLEEKVVSAREELFNYIAETYDISYFDKRFCVKMNSVFGGSYKGLTRPVPPEDLLDMWKQKKTYLDKVADQNKRKGNPMDGIGRANYDLAILLSRYDSYLDWKEKQKLALSEVEEQKKKVIDFVEYKDLAKPQIQKENNKIDINSMLDEI